LWPCEWEALSRFAKVDRVILLRRVVPEGTGTGFSLNTEPGKQFLHLPSSKVRVKRVKVRVSCRCWPSLHLSFDSIVCPRDLYFFPLRLAIYQCDQPSPYDVIRYATRHWRHRRVSFTRRLFTDLSLSFLSCPDALLRYLEIVQPGDSLSVSLIENGSITRLR
jgi:hypothetical protein